MPLFSPTKLVLHMPAHARGSGMPPEQTQSTLIAAGHFPHPSTAALGGRRSGADASVTSGVELTLDLRIRF